MPKDLAQLIIDKGGLTINFTTYKLRPHTTITRCQNCQNFHHTARNCRARAPVCVNCGQSEKHEHCEHPPHCVNCAKINKTSDQYYNTNHKASDSNCGAYREAFHKERQRLDSIFNLRRTPSTTHPSRSPPTHQQRRKVPLLRNPEHSAHYRHNDMPPLGSFDYYNQDLYAREQWYT